MSSLVIAGDTSGSVTLQAPAVAGSTVLSLPATSGTVLTASGGATAGGVAYGNGTTTAFSAAGTSGQALVSGGAGAPTWGNPSTATNLAGGAASQLHYQTGVGTTGFIANGTSGQVLQSAGAGTPVWATPATGAMTLISTKNATSGLVWTGLSGYNNYILVFNNLSYNNASLVNLYIQLGTGATPTYTTSGYYTNSSGRTDNNGSTSPAANTSLNAAQGNLNANLNWFTNTSSFNGYMYSTGFTSSASQGVLSYMCFQDTTNIIYGFMNDSVTNTITSPITAIRLYGNTSSSTFGGGTASLYGISS